MINDEYLKCNKNSIMKLVAIKIKQDTKENKINADTNSVDLSLLTIRTKKKETSTIESETKKTNIKTKNKNI